MAWTEGDGYTEEIRDAICDEIVSGLYLPQICKKPGFPARSLVYRWLARFPEFEKAYAAACRARSWADADECEEIATGRHRTQGGIHNPFVDEDVWVRRDKLMLYNKEKQMAWSNPTRYGAVKQDPTPEQRPEAKVIELHDEPGQVDPVGQDE